MMLQTNKWIMTGIFLLSYQAAYSMDVTAPVIATFYNTLEQHNMFELRKAYLQIKDKEPDQAVALLCSDKMLQFIQNHIDKGEWQDLRFLSTLFSKSSDPYKKIKDALQPALLRAVEKDQIQTITNIFIIISNYFEADEAQTIACYDALKKYVQKKIKCSNWSDIARMVHICKSNTIMYAMIKDALIPGFYQAVVDKNYSALRAITECMPQFLESKTIDELFASNSMYHLLVDCINNHTVAEIEPLIYLLQPTSTSYKLINEHILAAFTYAIEQRNINHIISLYTLVCHYYDRAIGYKQSEHLIPFAQELITQNNKQALSRIAFMFEPRSLTYKAIQRTCNPDAQPLKYTPPMASASHIQTESVEPLNKTEDYTSLLDKQQNRAAVTESLKKKEKENKFKENSPPLLKSAEKQNHKQCTAFKNCVSNHKWKLVGATAFVAVCAAYKWW